ncbi:TIGR04255 family protein [Stutzerimonas stutzeri]|jgi:uncharacterized protein (TIGR04255 family)|uniref:TIGR04255 family protein n=1 Tax=Stutzerimonas stutzeri TaxID=316 RepID=UPI0018AB148F|nr:TIGR04255 family protein [Stutzerimonas stutzeri]QPI09742.1 TIGR04255 family protein [Stutzerimonas stutzeri]
MIPTDKTKRAYQGIMAITFDNAPLIEAVAELRWGAASTMPAQMLPGQTITFGPDASASEDFFMNFGGECSALGMQRAERIVPQGFPVLPGQVVYRFRSGDKNVHTLLQVGNGVFSANALPPYPSWDLGFKELIGNGVEALLNSRPSSEKGAKFSTLSLRYINGFDEKFRAGLSGEAFLNKLGFSIGKPGKLNEIFGREDQAIGLSINSRVDDKHSVQVNIGEGLKDGAPATMVELTVTTMNVSPDKEEILRVFQTSHDLVEEIFLDMTRHLRDLMKPREV